MIYALFGLLALAALLPLGLTLLRPAAPRGRREADLALYRAQLAELGREHVAGRLSEEAHAAAVLEVQRRLLAAPEETPAAPGRAALPAAVLLTVPALAALLYLVSGRPELPSVTFVERQAVVAEEETLLANLRARIASFPASSEQARRGWLLLAEAERSRGRLAEATAAYRAALAARFDADGAAQLAQVLLEANDVPGAATLLAEALPRAPDHVGLRFLSGLAEERAGHPAAARAAWSALLAEAPPDVPWRGMVERRLEALP